MYRCILKQFRAVPLLLFFFVRTQSFLYGSGTPETASSSTYYRFSIGRTEGKGLGFDTGYSSIGSLLFPDTHQKVRPFIDLRYHFRNGCRPYAANLGLGVRIQSQTLGSVLGINIYYDTKKTHHHSLNQMGIGFESLGEIFNIRLNGYLPISHKKIKTSSSLYSQYTDGYYILQENFLNTRKGLNFELEARLLTIYNTPFFLGMGGYYYNNCSSCKNKIYGTEYTLRAQPTQFITLKVGMTHDNVFKTRIQAQVCIELPFIDLSEMERRLFQPVKRVELIVTPKRSRWTYNF